VNSLFRKALKYSECRGMMGTRLVTGKN